MPTLDIVTHQHCELIDITAAVRRAIRTSGVVSGQALLFVPHTTAAVTINENADPDVVTDLLAGLDRLVPHDPSYRHAEGNSPAHLKSSLIGVSLALIVADGAPLLGTWQGIYFCEFDGPRRRQLHLQIGAA
jgi:secondary thiamine-phosphate synthase enzyme